MNFLKAGNFGLVQVRCPLDIRWVSLNQWPLSEEMCQVSSCDYRRVTIGMNIFFERGPCIFASIFWVAMWSYHRPRTGLLFTAPQHSTTMNPMCIGHVAATRGVGDHLLQWWTAPISPLGLTKDKPLRLKPLMFNAHGCASIVSNWVIGHNHVMNHKNMWDNNPVIESHIWLFVSPCPTLKCTNKQKVFEIPVSCWF